MGTCILLIRIGSWLANNSLKLCNQIQLCDIQMSDFDSLILLNQRA